MVFGQTYVNILVSYECKTPLCVHTIHYASLDLHRYNACNVRPYTRYIEPFRRVEQKGLTERSACLVVRILPHPIAATSIYLLLKASFYSMVLVHGGGEAVPDLCYRHHLQV